MIRIRLTIEPFILTGLLLSCLSGLAQHPNQKEVAEKNRIGATRARQNKENADSTERSKFRKEALARIKSNQQGIERLRNKTSFENNVAQRDYKIKVLVLEKQNNELRMAVLRSDEIDHSKWKTFKQELNTLLDALTQAIKEVNELATSI